MVTSPLRKVSSQSEDHQRHHLDLYADNQEAEVERLIGLGAQGVSWRYPDGADYIVLADPDGNRFCVVQRSGVSQSRAGGARDA
jgi:catechol 2,3-dioxygenase-like lactoylglutathione lyase family enzyme